MRLFSRMILIVAITFIVLISVFLVVFELNINSSFSATNEGKTGLNILYQNYISPFSTSQSKNIQIEALYARNYLFFSLLLLGICFISQFVILLNCYVVLPISRLNQELVDIGSSGLLSGRVRSGSDDEIGDLAASINKMLVLLEKATDQRSVTEQRLSRLIALAEEGISLIDSDYKIWFANPKMASIFGTTPNKLVGCTINSLLGSKATTENINYLLSDQTARQEYHTRRFDGNELYISVVGAPYLPENDTDGYLCVFSDITPFKETEKALLLSNKKLGLMGSMTRHDIVNQLMTIRGMLDLIHRELNDKTLISMIEAAEDAAGRIKKHIEFSQEYQKAGIAAPEWQNLEANINLAYAMAKRTGLVFFVDVENYEIYADQLLMKVFYNLIDNSLKHGKNVSLIYIKVLMQGKNLVIIYEDDGKGISDEMKERVFERGVGSGTGWGLFFVREVLGLTGITITETGQFGKGAKFEITVPDGGYRREIVDKSDENLIYISDHEPEGNPCNHHHN